MPRLRSRHLAIASFWNGVGWATDNPVRRMMIGEVAGPARMGRAMSMDIGANNASRVVGSTLGGLLLVSVDVAGVFCLAAVLYGLALAAAFRLQVRNAGGTGGVVGQRRHGQVVVGGVADGAMDEAAASVECDYAAIATPVISAQVVKA
jgi:MFS family permease